ncbi:DNA damage-regulated autophagy modulator protein 1-like isoform X1 [Diabrotica virgifera virgifera]|uniref:CWH43-like N-terminal domain-containing protein n=1 Tax=Diabrotica virgifera virgifera TaxID=50390 RepID=A0ABM5KII6_DIAVI|nr:DNA damage-regulated autophagy modulator protein 1-like isoform X1 [Diabrotica virgifera virgifera]
MAFTKIYIFPILFGIWIPLTVFITFTVSVLTEHVRPLLPYISDTGTWAPESCIFGIMLTFGSIFLLIIVYVRYRYLQEVQRKNNYSPTLRKINKAGLYVGYVSIFGCLIVANFQVSETFIVHNLGAFSCFGCGAIYQVIQVKLSFKMYPTIGHRKNNIFRAVVTAISCLTFITTFICAALSIRYFTGTDMTKWKQEDGGYEFHIASAVSEYVLVISTVLHIVTYFYEFRTIEFNEPPISIKGVVAEA